jgi:hypothetical protein
MSTNHLQRSPEISSLVLLESMSTVGIHPLFWVRLSTSTPDARNQTALRQEHHGLPLSRSQTSEIDHDHVTYPPFSSGQKTRVDQTTSVYLS